MSYALEIAQLAEETSKRQRFLHPMLFDLKGQMYEDMRQKLLKIANFFIEKAIGHIPSLEVSDIVLCGSCARYDYRQNSDFDIKIIVKSINTSVIQNTEDAICDLLALVAGNYYGHKIFTKINGIPVDVKFDAVVVDFLGHYSILNNHWIIKPDKQDGIDTDIDRMIKNYYRKLCEISRFMAGLPMENGVYSVEEINQINDFFSQLNHASPEDYPAYKLLCKSGKMQEFGTDCVFAATASLSLE